MKRQRMSVRGGTANQGLWVPLAVATFLLTYGTTFGDEITVEESITYGKAGDTELKLDMARPEGAGPFPAIVFIHGGGWRGGNRQAFRASAEEAAKRGYVGVTISYRLMQFDESQKDTTTATPIFPAQIHDAKAAVRWLRANAKKYHVDPDRIGVRAARQGLILPCSSG